MYFTNNSGQDDDKNITRYMKNSVLMCFILHFYYSSFQANRRARTVQKKRSLIPPKSNLLKHHLKEVNMHDCDLSATGMLSGSASSVIHSFIRQSVFRQAKVQRAKTSCERHPESFLEETKELCVSGWKMTMEAIRGSHKAVHKHTQKTNQSETTLSTGHAPPPPSFRRAFYVFSSPTQLQPGMPTSFQ